LNVQTNPGAWTYQWQYMPDNSWINLANDTLYSGAQSNTLHISTVTSDINNIPFRCIISRTDCSMLVSDEAFIELLELPNAQFSTLQNNNTITFVNQSLNASQFHWDFGDMNSDTSAQTTHTYLQDGQYTVILTAWNGCDTSISEQIIDIYTIPEAEFEIIGNTVGCFSVTLQFNNTSSINATAWNWTFPGGTPASSNEKSPEVTYSNPGQYMITLIASNAGGADTSVQQLEVSVFSFPIAAFSYQIGPDGSVDFIYGGQGATSVSWDFGDGIQGDTSLNPTHIYLEEGEYVVSLTVINPCGAATIQQNVSIILSPTLDIKNHQRLLYPNPTSGICYLQLEPNEPVQSIQIRNAAGQLQIWQGPNAGVNTALDLTHLPNGIYWCQLILEDQCVDFKIIKQNP
jgi:PKD repeat protein